MRSLAVILFGLCSAMPALAVTGPYDVAPTCTPPAPGAPNWNKRNCNANHRVFLPSGASSTWQDRLVVILPGTNNEPKDHDQLGRMAAEAGFRTIVLSYDNRQENGTSSESITGFCEDTFGTAPQARTCHERVAEAILYGADSTTPSALNMDDEDTVIVRLMDVLDKLYVGDLMNGTNDYEWDRYYTNLVVDGSWCDIILAGFSQGNTVAAVQAIHEDLGGLVMLDGPAGAVEASLIPGMPATTLRQSWRLRTPATDGALMFGAFHTTKSISPHPAWNDLGVPGNQFTAQVVSSGGAALTSHRVEVDLGKRKHPAAPPSFTCTFHKSMAHDFCYDRDPVTGEIKIEDIYVDMFEQAALATDADCLP